MTLILMMPIMRTFHMMMMMNTWLENPLIWFLTTMRMIVILFTTRIPCIIPIMPGWGRRLLECLTTCDLGPGITVRLKKMSDCASGTGFQKGSAMALTLKISTDPYHKGKGMRDLCTVVIWTLMDIATMTLTGAFDS